LGSRAKRHRFGGAVVGIAVVVSVLALVAARAAEPVPSDAEVMTIVGKHCVMCHAQKPAHPSFVEPPGGVALETIEQVRKFARRVYEQTVLDRAMPVGNETGMTEAERERVGAWFKALK
jgi:uncharacterized membrane protein